MQTKYLVGSAFGLLLSAVPGVALAQTETAAIAEAQPGDIIVTATRREERLQDVPVAVSAFNTETLARQGIVKTEDLARIAPGLNISRFVGNPTSVAFGIRGQRTSDIRANNDPSVVIYLAEVPIQMPFGVGLSGFLDLQRVEVLRGPQGTLFGKNATGGAVLLVPNTPTDKLGGEVKFTVGSFSKIEGQATVNLPLGEGVGLRVSGLVGHQGSWYRNRAAGYRDFDKQDYGAARASFQVKRDDFTTTFYGDYVDFRGTSHPGKVVAINPAVASAAVQTYAAQEPNQPFYSSYAAFDTPVRTKSWGVSNTTTVNLSDTLTLKNVIGYRDVSNLMTTATDGTPSILVANRPLIDTNKQFSEELQIQYNAGALQLIGGGFYMHNDGTDVGFATTSGVVNSSLFDFTIKGSTKSLFLEGTYDITPQFHLTLGGRYTWDWRYRATRTRTTSAAGVVACRVAGTTLANNCFGEGGGNFRKFTFNITGQYEFDSNNQVYASWRRGYRGGGYTLDAANATALTLPYQPEVVDTYELGYKGKIELGGSSALRLDLAGYYSDYKGLQRSSRGLVNGFLTTATVNAGKAVVYGFEAEANLSLSDRFTLTASYTYTNADYKVFVVSGVDRSASPWSYQPRHKLTASARYEVPVGDGYIAFQPSVVSYSSQFLDENADVGTLEPAYALVNGRIEWAPSDQLTLALFANNLLNKKYYVSGNGVYSSIGFTAKYPGERQMFGAQLQAKF